MCVGEEVGERGLGVGVFKNCTNSLYKLNSNLIFIYKHSRIARVFTADAATFFLTFLLPDVFLAVSFDFLFCLLATAVITLKRTVVKIFEMLRTKSKLVLRDGFAVANAPGQNNHCPTGWNDSRE